MSKFNVGDVVTRNPSKINVGNWVSRCESVNMPVRGSYTVTHCDGGSTWLKEISYVGSSDCFDLMYSVDDPKPEPVVKEISAASMMQAGLDAMVERASSRDAEDGERSMKATVDAFNAMYGKDISEEQGWSFMVMLKLARAKGGEFRDDDYIDGSAYFALAGECAAKERG